MGAKNYAQWHPVHLQSFVEDDPLNTTVGLVIGRQNRNPFE